MGTENRVSQRIWKQLAGDVAAGTISAVFVAPLVTVIDRALTEKVATGESLSKRLRSCSKMLLQPTKMFLGKPFAIMWSVYASTYVVANGAETLATEFQEAHVGSIVFFSTMFINTPMGIWKDLSFAALFGGNKQRAITAGTSNHNIAATNSSKAELKKAVTAAPTMAPVVSSGSSSKKPFSRPAMSAFLLRDVITVYGSFVMAREMKNLIPSSLVRNEHAKNVMTQFTVPALSQVLATPSHLVGLDYHNRRQRISVPQRLRHIREHIPSATFGRSLRIIPPFSFGILANIEMREYFHKKGLA